ncbi:cytochrome P450 monooxygenase [Striga asiatica]|uniref:Cytochrome P450 monooxygenase n=1 Tax=Striga asiatica TaxID=4170 RepID=A0A5A7QNK4_STRAF|nr:cytochrome P450 monooxygenase [Striga asiatica]
MTDLASKHKTYRLVAPFRNEVYTSDPANVEYILKTNFENFGKGWHNYGILNDLLGDGIFAVDGEKWRERRKVSSLEFSARALRDVSSTIFKENAVKLAKIFSEAVASNQPMNIQDLFMKSTLDSIFRVAFGVELDSMCGSNEEGSRFSRAFDDASEITAWRYVDILWKIKKALNIGLEAKLKANIRIIDEFVYKLIHNKTKQIEQVQYDDNADLRKQDILTRFLKLSGGEPKYLRDIILNFVMVGKDMTATTMSWFFFMLCKHPLVQEKAAREIEITVKYGDENANLSEFAANLSEEALDKMHYLHAALTETETLSSGSHDGFSVRKGDVVAYQPYAMGRMKSIWGDNARDFKPERWIDYNGCFKPESPFKFTAFQGGPRICLGKDFAYRQMKILTAVLLRFFVFKASEEKKAVKYRTMINLHIAGGLSVRACRRSDYVVLT